MDEGAIRSEARQRPDGRHDPRLDWWRDAKFGLFIHWGLYAVPAGQWQGQAIEGIGEWIMHRARIPVAEYEQLAAQFNPTAFDADVWVRLAKEAGQKYIVITAKHHDGFCLYHTQLTPYNIVDATPFKRDPIAELAAACARHDMRLGFYYSQTQDWHHPGGDGNDWDYDEASKDFDGYIENYVKPQVTELLSNYGPVCLIWFDTPKRIKPEQSRALVGLVHTLQPDCLVNGRIGNALGDYAEARDNRIPEAAVDEDWEVPATINDTWGFKADDQNWKSTEDLIRKLVDIASKGGNYLLNVGPTAEGIIPQPSIERLQAMGAWLRANGEAVYGTRPGPIQRLDWCRSTVAGDRLYLHVFDWPKGGRFSPKPKGLKRPIQRAYLLSDPGKPFTPGVYCKRDILQGPAKPPDSVDSVVVFELG